MLFRSISILRDIFDHYQMICFQHHCGSINGFVVHLLLAFPASHKPVTNKTTCLRHNLLGTKGTVAISVHVGRFQLVCCGSHLPFALSDDVSRDTEALRVLELANSMMTDKATLIWAGDMNYRFDKGGDQLLRFLLPFSLRMSLARKNYYPA